MNAGSQLKSDFRLRAGSPAINAGSLQLTNLFDYSRSIRPVDILPDIGAYEYSGSSPSVGTTPTKKPTIRVFPNPVGDGHNVTIDSDQIFKEVVIYSEKGQELSRYSVDSNNANLALPLIRTPVIIFMEIRMKNGYVARHKVLIE